MAVGKGQQRDLVAFQALLDHHLLAGLAELAAQQHGAQACFGFGQGIWHEHPFAGCQPRSFDHHRVIQAAQVGQRLLEVTENGIARRWDAVPGHELFGEGFGGFDLGGGARRPKDGDVYGLQVVHQAGGQRRLRPHDDQVHRF